MLWFNNNFSVFCAIQKVYSQLSSRRAHTLFQIAQINELLAKIIAYNLTVVIHEMFENGIEPSFLHK